MRDGLGFRKMEWMGWLFAFLFAFANAGLMVKLGGAEWQHEIIIQRFIHLVLLDSVSGSVTDRGRASLLSGEGLFLHVWIGTFVLAHGLYHVFKNGRLCSS